MLKSMWYGKYKATLLTKIMLVAALVYIISPIDLIPDFIPILGWTDDGFVFWMLLRRLLTEAVRFQNQFSTPETKGKITLVSR